MYLGVLCVCSTYEALVITQIEFCRGSFLSMLQLLTTQYAFSLNFIIIFLSFPSSHDFSHKTQCLPNFLKSLFFSYTAQAQIDSIYRFNLFVMDGGDRPIKIGGGDFTKSSLNPTMFFFHQ